MSRLDEKKKTYQELLKENLTNLSEFDTTQAVDVKGPMLDPILRYEGDGELPTYKDAASVLERYYFGEKRQEHEINEMDYENDKGDSGGENMKHTEGPSGEEQMGTSNANNPKGSEAEKEKDIAKEGEEIEGESVSEKEMNTADLKSGNMKDTEGQEGEEQAGTGNTYTDFKKRVVEAIESISEEVDVESLDEQEEEEDKENPEHEAKESKEEEEKERKTGKEDEEKEEKEEMKEQSAVPGGPSPKKSGEGEDEDWDEGRYYEESETQDVTEALENEIIEKIISEMEEIDEQDAKEKEAEGKEEEAEGKEKEAEAEEEEEEGLDVDKKMEEMVNRLTQGHTEGPGGEEQAGTGGDEKVIPPRKDRSNEGTGEKGTKPMDKSELADA